MLNIQKKNRVIDFYKCFINDIKVSAILFWLNINNFTLHAQIVTDYKCRNRRMTYVSMNIESKNIF